MEDQTALILGVMTTSAPAITMLLTNILGALTKETGKELRDIVYGPPRLERARDTLATGSKMLSDAGLRAQQVPPRILVPILQHSSLETEEPLRQAWAALMANAASPNPAHNKILPAYAEILRQLTVQQAKILQWIYGQVATTDIPIWPDVTRADIKATLDIESTDYAVMMSDMDRLQLIEGHRQVGRHPSLKTDNDVRRILLILTSPVKYDVVGLTTLGVHFMRACNPPQAVTGP